MSFKKIIGLTACVLMLVSATAGCCTNKPGPRKTAPQAVEPTPRVTPPEVIHTQTRTKDVLTGEGPYDPGD